MKVVCFDKWQPEAKEILKNHLTFEGGHNFADSIGFISRLNWKVTTELLDDMPKLRFVASCTTGLDHIDVDYCKRRGIEIISLQGETDLLRDVWATAEHTWALILSLVRRIPWAFDDVKQGSWERERWQGSELRGKTLGIVGYGRVGQQVARFAEAFGMRVAIYDPYYRNCDQGFYGTANTYSGLEGLLRTADIITVHVPLTDETKNMFGYEQFAQMKSSVMLINTSRGLIINETDLLAALKNKAIAGAALDVLQNEPNVNPEFIRYAKENTNLLLTCHLGGNTQESRKATQCFIASKIRGFIENEQTY